MQMEKLERSTGDRPLGVKDYILYFAGYTLLFAMTAAAVFVWFWLVKKRFIWKTDGVNQHWYGLVYFSRWGKEVIRQFQETHVLRVPTFSLRMGYGEDLFTTLAYYVIGDPFSLPAVFVPEQYLMHFHDLMLMVRFWLAGITFSAYAFSMGRKSRLGVAAGSLIYIFNGFTMSGMRHHYFLNPFVFFPLILIGCERYFRKKKPGLFIFMVFLSAVSNFYFFYMLVIMTVLYAVWRSLRLRGLRRLGRVILDGIAFLFYGALGTLLASVVFLPVILRFLQDPRAAATKSIPLLWTESFYRNFADCFLTNGTAALAESWTYMGFGAVAALCILFIFAGRRKHFDLKASFIGLTCLLMTPAAAYVLNGFSYPANRWMFAYALLVAFMAATAIPEMAEASWKHLTAAFVLMFLLAAACAAWKYTFSRASGQAFIIALFGLGAVLLGRVVMLEKRLEKSPDAGALSEKRSDKPLPGRKISVRVQAALLVCVFLTIVSEAYFAYSPERSGRVYEYLSRAQIEVQTAKDAAAAAQLIDGELLKKEGEPVPFYRYTAYNPENNTSMLYGVSNTQYYWSLSNQDVTKFLVETGQSNRMIHQFDTLDESTSLNEIAGVRYFLGNDKEGLPFGYEKTGGRSYDNASIWPEFEGGDRYSCQVYENKFALPLGFTSDRWISREDYDAMDIPQRRQALMQGILLDSEPAGPFTRIRPEENAAGGVGAAESAKTAQAAETGAAESANAVSFTDRRMPVRFETDSEKITVSGLAAGTGIPEANGAMAVSGKGERISFQVHEAPAVVSLYFDGMAACETGLSLRGMQYQPPEGKNGSTKFLISVKGFSGQALLTDKQLGFTTPADPWTTGQTDFLVNMRYHKEALDRIDITLPAEGTYSFDDMQAVCQPMTAYPAQAEAFRQTTLRDLDIHEMGGSFATDRITGRIDLDAPRILCLQIPCTPGWTAYVDGVRADLIKADTMFSALLLPEGSHDIELRYQTPGLRLGAVISAGTLLLILVFGLLYLLISLILRLLDRKGEEIPEGNFQAVEMPESGETGIVRETNEE